MVITRFSKKNITRYLPEICTFLLAGKLMCEAETFEQIEEKRKVLYPTIALISMLTEGALGAMMNLRWRDIKFAWKVSNLKKKGGLEEEIIKEYKFRIKEDARAGFLWTDLGLNYGKRGKFDLTLDAYAKAMQSPSKNPVRTGFFLSDLVLDCIHYFEERENFEKEIQADQTNIYPRLSLILWDPFLAAYTLIDPPWVEISFA